MAREVYRQFVNNGAKTSEVVQVDWASLLAEHWAKSWPDNVVATWLRSVRSKRRADLSPDQ